ncbi:tetratricopeptide repeat protein 33 isoform X5 [Salmo salar]|uniref:Tetratricopeptide repeat protein 33 isoform X5 n=1 Tax=Salmo salar TaxID=8030 RepID=A0A1S3LUU6_SALSA|nr:tetratricopeptide repeat protein 33 isoform X5 [Salmo salar]|eukprot:XP_013994758.1 PREDICTED: tetratricopeptide repeat protein 33-like isoform X5 [Salmo salar]
MLASYLPNSTSRNLTGIPNFRMASFGWKRKVGERVCKAAVQQFEAAAEKPEEDGVDEVDWLHAIKRRREVLLEDCAAKGNRLKEEGTVLAQEGRHWEAIKRWDEAIQLTPDNPLLYEMKSQVLTILQEVFPAVQAAEMAVKLRPLWWEGWQTLGRAQLSLGGEVLPGSGPPVSVRAPPLVGGPGMGTAAAAAETDGPGPDPAGGGGPTGCPEPSRAPAGLRL